VRTDTTGNGYLEHGGEARFALVEPDERTLVFGKKLTVSSGPQDLPFASQLLLSCRVSIF